MNTLQIFLLIFSASLAFKTIPTASWELDTAHSNLHFTVTHLMVSDIEGSFKIKEATLTTPNDDFTDAVITLKTDIATIDTDNDQRDEHLRTADFFDVEKYPVMTFNSTYFKKVDNNKYLVTGDLSFHGITKSITLDVIAHPGTQPWDKKSIVGFKVNGTINRIDFGIGATTPSALLSEDVAIVANVIFSKNE
jgi:polyisoprenoid-binding protein YceI